MKGGFLRTAVGAGAAAGVLSGLPSTLIALVQGSDPLEATEAAGTILLPEERRRNILLVAAVPVHGSISLAWATAMTAFLPRRRTVLWGAIWGLAIAALDLGPLARPFPSIRALQRGPQVADHLAFGLITAVWVQRCRAHGAQHSVGTVGSVHDRRPEE
jgi:hypothetical protein